MQVTYTGETGVAVYDRARDVEVFFEPGETVDVPDELGRSLLDQAPATWSSGDYDPHPSKSAGKGEWEAFRSAQGHDVAGLTKDELIALPDVPVVVDGEG